LHVFDILAKAVESAITVVQRATNDSCTEVELCGRHPVARQFPVSTDMKTLVPQNTLWNIDPGPDCPAVARMVVEIGNNSSNKYEYDPHLQLFRLDRALYSPMHFPGDYGFIPGTVAEDDEPIDVLALVEQPSFPGCMIRVRPVGMLDMLEESKCDHKILAVPERSPRFEQIRGLADVPSHILTEVQHFFEIYKELEGLSAEMKGWQNLDQARAAIAESRRRYQDLHEAAQSG
jgi:inorganic pyrophosphatase